MSEPAAPGDVRSLPLPEGLDGLRLDVALSRLFGFSRTTAAGLIDGGAVRVDELAAGRSDRVSAGAWLEVTLPAAPAPVAARPLDGRPFEGRLPDGSAGGDGPPEPRLEVLYADDDIVVIDKPVGVAAHASPGWTGPTVTGAMAARGIRLSDSGPPERQGIVHRLDVGTSGVLVLAASDRAYTVLKRAFKERTVDKRYSALVQGHPDPSAGTIDAPIGRHPGADYKFAVTSDGRPSVTHYTTVEAFPGVSLLDVRLETGRTHQIRVHMAALRHPCAGDLTYGADPALAERLGLHRQWLHARELGFRHPATGVYVAFTSPFPPDLEHALTVARGWL